MDVTHIFGAQKSGHCIALHDLFTEIEKYRIWDLRLVAELSETRHGSQLLVDGRVKYWKREAMNRRSRPCASLRLRG